MSGPDPAVLAERRFVAGLPLEILRYRYLRWRRKRRSTVARVAPRKDGLLMAVDEADVIDFHIRHFGDWEPGLGALIAAHLKQGDRAVDIGANIGAHTLTMARCVGPEGVVTAVEPGPETVNRLRQNVDLNALAQVRVLEVAASDSEGRATLYDAPDGTRGRASLDADVTGKSTGAEIRTVIAASICSDEDWRRTRLIKIDVERAEDRVLRGLAPIFPLLPDDCVLVVEAEPQALIAKGAPLDSLVAPLIARGFAFFALEQRVDMKSMLRGAGAILRSVSPDTVKSAAHTDFVIASPAVASTLSPR